MPSSTKSLCYSGTFPTLIQFLCRIMYLCVTFLFSCHYLSVLRRPEYFFCILDVENFRFYLITHLFQVVWKITDGKKGMNEIQQWLINIQARAPNSPVIIVGTHLDVVKVAH